jgi:hypothetical protein
MVMVDQSICGAPGERKEVFGGAEAPKPKKPSGAAWRRARRAKAFQRMVPTLTQEGVIRIAEVLPPARVPTTLAEVAAELRRVFWESRTRLIPDDVASHQAYVGMQALKATELETQKTQIDTYLQRMREPRQQLVTAYRYGTDTPIAEQAEVQQP